MKNERKGQRERKIMIQKRKQDLMRKKIKGEERNGDRKSGKLNQSSNLYKSANLMIAFGDTFYSNAYKY